MNKLNIIIAEDDVDDQFLIDQAFTNLQIPIQLTFFKNGRDLLQFLFLAADTGDLPNVIILDLNMPLIDGQDVLRKLKGDSSLKAVPVFILTTSRRPEHVKICNDFKCSGFYNKPYKMQDLQAIVKEISEKAGKIKIDTGIN